MTVPSTTSSSSEDGPERISKPLSDRDGGDGNQEATPVKKSSSVNTPTTNETQDGSKRSLCSWTIIPLAIILLMGLGFFAFRSIGYAIQVPFNDNSPALPETLQSGSSSSTSISHPESSTTTSHPTLIVPDDQRQQVATTVYSKHSKVAKYILRPTAISNNNNIAKDFTVHPRGFIHQEDRVIQPQDQRTLQSLLGKKPRRMRRMMRMNFQKTILFRNGVTPDAWIPGQLAVLPKPPAQTQTVFERFQQGLIGNGGGMRSKVSSSRGRSGGGMSKRKSAGGRSFQRTLTPTEQPSASPSAYPTISSSPTRPSQMSLAPSHVPSSLPTQSSPPSQLPSINPSSKPSTSSSPSVALVQ